MTHPALQDHTDKRTFGERAADHMREGLGTWTFILTFTGILVLWIVTGGFGDDPNPYFRLNLGLSCLAAIQGAVILIAQKRADRVASELADHHYTETQKIDTLLASNTKLTQEIHKLTLEIHESKAKTPRQRTPQRGRPPEA